jgi:DNA-directed RNA polymerase specialized sigma24 family protein
MKANLMLDQRLNAATLETHEQLFTARYQQLLAWSLHLTDHDRAEAKDLLHDAYIQFTLMRPDLKAIRNLDGYLSGTLRMLWLSRQRRTARARLQQLSMIEYDSAEMGLWLSDPRELNRIQDELRAICRYACARKQNSKAGCVLILRFFHGYYPAEIARVLQTTRKAVDSRLALARQEARLYLEAPERLGFIKSNSKTVKTKVAPGDQGGTMIKVATNTTTNNQDDLLRELRAEIFQSRQGECFARADLQRLYSGSEAEAVDVEQLDHLVSCPVCLDLVNEILGLPLLSQRHPNDTLGNDPGDSGHSSTSGTTGAGPVGNVPAGTKASSTLERRARQRALEVFEHRPQELHIAVNGRLVASQKVYAEVNEQTLELRPEDLAELPSFIEIFSDQGVRMLLLPVEAVAGTASPIQAVQAELSEGRMLALTLQCQAAAGLLTVVYHDPLARPEVEPEPQLSWLDRTTAWLRAAFAATLSPRPALLAALTVILCAVGLLAYLRWPTTPVVTAAELLQKSIATEARFAGERGQVTHRTFKLETRDAATGQVHAQRRVELWQSAAHGIVARRLYNEQNQLVAGEWQRADGSSELLFRKGHGTDKSRPPTARQAAEVDPLVWRAALDVRQFAALVGAVTATVEERPNVYVLSYQLLDGGVAIQPGQLRKASLTLNRHDLRAVAQTLLLRTAEGEREHHLSEAGFEQLPANSVSPALFQPDPELLAAGIRRTEAHAPTSIAVADSNAPEKTNATNLAALEVEARYLLDQAGANLGEQVMLTRTAADGLQLRALAETPQRKAELLAALAPLRGRPNVTLEIETYDEAAQRQLSKKSAPGIITDAVITQKPLPVAAELRRYFAAQAVRQTQADNWVEEQVTRFAGQMQEQAPRPLRHAWALNTLATTFSPAELAALPPEAKAKWRKMARTHALAVKHETKQLRVALQPLFFPNAGSAPGPEEIAATSLNQLAARLVALTSEHDTIIGKAFSKSAHESADAQLKSPRFWQSLRRVEQLAEAVLKTSELAGEN